MFMTEEWMVAVSGCEGRGAQVKLVLAHKCLREFRY
jgi:hypothetical protein